MSNVFSLADARERRLGAVADMLALAVDPVLQRLDAISSTSEQERAANVWPLEADACVAMIVDEAEAMRPDLRTNGVDRTMMWEILAELRTAFGENAAEKVEGLR